MIAQIVGRTVRADGTAPWSVQVKADDVGDGAPIADRLIQPRPRSVLATVKINDAHPSGRLILVGPGCEHMQRKSISVDLVRVGQSVEAVLVRVADPRPADLGRVEVAMIELSEVQHAVREQVQIDQVVNDLVEAQRCDVSHKSFRC